MTGQTVFAECMAVFSELREMEQEMEDLTGRMSELDHSSSEYAQVAQRYQRLEHEFRTRDGYAIEAQVGAVLMGLGFRKEDWYRRTEEFSGGWQMLVRAALSLRGPSLTRDRPCPCGDRRRWAYATKQRPRASRCGLFCPVGQDAVCENASTS